MIKIPGQFLGLTAFSNNIINQATDMFSSVVSYNQANKQILLTLAAPYSWYSTENSRRVVIWSGIAYKVAVSNSTSQAFVTDAFSIPSLDGGGQDIGFIFQTVNETQATIMHASSAAPTVSYVPTGSIFAGTPDNYSYILIFCFFN
jgi:hypothetical protein